ncbi:MAG: ATP synthase F1 subunit delta [Crocinitomicaceae bacterium]|nr:ATP synthase F1 subunit delta [Crocinitomicaceae bacterium]|tara:strand:- start:1748 stop:2302 length:555 start_codon:yes stop_codon:yes gene_type:complete
MVANKVARRYAKSLMLLAQELNELEKALMDMQLIQKVIGENHDLRAMFKSPVIKTYKKLNIVDRVFGNDLGDLVKGFVKIITQNKRSNLLEEIAVGLTDLYNEYNQVVVAHVKTATAMDDALRAKITSIVATMDHKSIELVEEVDPDLIGGAVLRVGDAQIDASVARQLQELKIELQESNYKNK